MGSACEVWALGHMQHFWKRMTDIPGLQTSDQRVVNGCFRVQEKHLWLYTSAHAGQLV